MRSKGLCTCRIDKTGLGTRKKDEGGIALALKDFSDISIMFAEQPPDLLLSAQPSSSSTAPYASLLLVTLDPQRDFRPGPILCWIV